MCIRDRNTTTGGAVGNGAATGQGGAIGANAESGLGGAVGFNAVTGQGFSGGFNAKTIDADGAAIDAIQLGAGTNAAPKSLQVYNYQLMDGDGNIPEDRVRSAIAGKADDDFMHIPLVVCDTAANIAVKEVSLPDYSPEKYPIIAVRFTNANTATDFMQLSVNGGTAARVVTGQTSSQGVTCMRYSMNANSTLLLTRASADDVWRIVNSHIAASNNQYGVTILANMPEQEPITTPNGTTRDLTGSAVTPNYVFKSSLNRHRSDQVYAKNDMVFKDGKIYRSLENGNHQNPVTDQEWWIQYGEMCIRDRHESAWRYESL